MTRATRDRGLGLALVGPALAVFAVFSFYPLARTVWLGLFRQDPFGRRREWVGLGQYRDVITSAEFRHSLRITVEFTLLTVPLTLALALGLASLANQHLPGMRVFRTIFASTVASSVAVAAMLWLVLLQPSVGVLNQLLEALGQERVDLLRDPDTALLAVAATTVWQNLGLCFLVLLAGLQSIPEELHESARLDGHGAWSRLVHVSVPLLGPHVLFLTVVLTIAGFQSFAQIDILTEGGPQDATNVVVYSIVSTLPGDPGRAAAEAVVLFVLLLGISMTQLFLLERRVHYGS